MPEETHVQDSDLDQKIADALEAAGFTTLEKVREATDDDLTAIKGIGPAALEKIRAAKPLELEDEGDAEKLAEYQRLIEDGMSDAEARATVWPDEFDAPAADDGDEDAADDDEEAADDAADDDGDEDSAPADEGGEDQAPAGGDRPAPRPTPRPRPQATAQMPAPAGCQWIRLRGKVRKIVTEAVIARTGQLVQICLFPGMRYAMPKDVHIGAAGRWHPMVVKEETQQDYPALDIADLAYSRWTVGRKEVSHFLAAASSVIEKHQGPAVAKEMVEQGPKAVLERYKALQAVKPDEIPSISYTIVDPDLPVYTLESGEVIPLVVDIDEEERANLLADDALCDPETGKSFATKNDLIRYQAQQARRRQIPEWMKRELDERLESAILRVPRGEVV